MQLWDMNKKIIFISILITILINCANAQPFTPNLEKLKQNSVVKPGAERMDTYLPMLKGKSVAVFANQTSVVGNTHLVDTLVKSGVKVVKIFGPEHGFRGVADAGEHVKDGIDKKSGLPVISLYGNHKKPTKEDLQDVDVLVFDIQDVGVRFYTFISSLEYLIEACAENNKPLILLDRPNPNGFYVDGPVLDKKFKSFIGMQPIPIVHGMTFGEYAYMLIMETNISNIGIGLNLKLNGISITTDNKHKENIDIQHSPNKRMKDTFSTYYIDLKIITCKNYTHNTKYILPINPSPNLREMQSIYLYPSTCFFEGTVLSEGRGTDKPFQIFGHPSLPKNLFAFTPMPNEGAKSSKCFNQLCYGWNLSDTKENVLKNLNGKIQLKYLLEAYKLFPQKDSFFLTNNFFHKLAGNDVLMKQIKAGKTEKEIKKSWEKDLIRFKGIRKKYLLYKDF
jgi:uncharacterized protein YbbC (DUF1343 family)